MQRFASSHRLHLALLAGALALGAASTGAAALVTEVAAQRAGLTRAWFTQAEMDTSRHAVTGAELKGDTLFVLTSASAVQAIDAETGRTRWKTHLGSPSQPTYGPSLHNGRVAFISGTTLYLLDAETGRELHQKRLDGPPGAAPALADDYCFVPLVSGRLVGYPLGEDTSLIWRFNTGGRMYDRPTVVGNHVVWTTDSKGLFCARSNGGGIDYRFKGASRLIAPAATLDETLYIASVTGHLYALDARRGKQLWRASIGIGIDRPVTAVAGVVYLGSDETLLHAFDASSGEEMWAVDGVDEFVARSAERVYAVGPGGELAVIDAATGRVSARWNGVGQLMPVTNDQNDRLYFVSENGLVQCLHETGLTAPVRHTPLPEGGAPATANETPADEAPDEEEAPADDGGFEDGGFDTEVEETPAQDAPADDPFDEDDPFADF